MTLLPQLFAGNCADVLTCLKCGNQVQRNDAFMDLTLPVAGMAVSSSSSTPPTVAMNTNTAVDGTTKETGSLVSSTTSSTVGPCTPYTSLHKALRAYTAPEILNGNNQWLCSKCNQKVDATKALVLTNLPPILTLHLKRFTFDPTTNKYAKVNDPFTFPVVFEADPFLHEYKATTPVPSINSVVSNNNTNSSSTPPSLTSVGSSKNAIHALRNRRTSLATEALQALAKGEVLTEEQEDILEFMEHEGKLNELKTSLASSSSSTTSTSSSNETTVSSVSSSSPHTNYELYAILMHSGNAARGHYYAFIREPLDNNVIINGDISSIQQKSWLLVNDTSVTRLTEMEVMKGCGASTMIDSNDDITLPHDKIDNDLPVSKNAKHIPTGGTAYMLLYRKQETNSLATTVSTIDTTVVLPSNIIPPSPSLAPLYTYAQSLGIGLLSTEVLNDIHQENCVWANLREAYSISQRLTELTVYIPSLSLNDEQSKHIFAIIKQQQELQSSILANGNNHSSNSTDNDSSSSSLQIITATPLTFPFQTMPLTVFLPNSTLIENACDTVYQAFVSMVRSRADGPLSPLKPGIAPSALSVPLPSRRNVRIRRYDPSTKRSLDTYTEPYFSNKDLQSLSLGLSTTMILEVRACGGTNITSNEPGLPWYNYDPEAINVRIIHWNQICDNISLDTRIKGLLKIAEYGVDAYQTALNNHQDGYSLELPSLNCDKLYSDTNQLKTVCIPGNPRPATGKTLHHLLQDMLPSVCQRNDISNLEGYLHCILLPGGIPLVDDITNGIAASRMRGRIAPAFTSCTRTGVAPPPGGVKVIKLPLSLACTTEDITDLTITLRKECSLNENDDIILLPEYTKEENTVVLGDILPLLRGLYASNTIRIQCNILSLLTDNKYKSALQNNDTDTLLGIPVPSNINKIEYPILLTARRDETLIALKQRMIDEIILHYSNTDHKDYGVFLQSIPQLLSLTHLRRNPRAPQLRDESRLLRDLDIGDGANLYLQYGAPLSTDSVLIKVYGWQSSTDPTVANGGNLTLVCTLPIPMKHHISTLKKSIHKRLNVTNVPDWLLPTTLPVNSFTPQHIRLRTKSTVLGSGSLGAILRDDSIVRQALTGSTSSSDNTGDERDVIIQVLPTEETINANDMIVRIVHLAFGPEETSQTSNGTLTGYDDLILTKSMTMRQLILAITKSYGSSSMNTNTTEEDIINIAKHVQLCKHSAYGPKLTAYEANQRLKWEGPIPRSILTMTDTEMTTAGFEQDGWNKPIIGAPLTLKDGCTLVWRNDGPESSIVNVNDSSSSTSTSPGKSISVHSDNKENVGEGSSSNNDGNGKPLKPWQQKGGRRQISGDVDVVVSKKPSSSSTNIVNTHKEVGIKINVKKGDTTNTPRSEYQ